jgi:anti-sigma factor RsiW
MSEHVDDDFSDYHDGSLAADRRAAVDAHLQSCARCRTEYESFREAVAQVGLLGRAAAPRGFDHRVADAIRHRSGGRFFGRRAFGDRVPFELLAVVGLAVLVAIYVLMTW